MGPSMQLLWLATRAGWLATRPALTSPSLQSPRTTLALATLLRTLFFTPAWSMGLILADLSTRRCHLPWRLAFPLDGALPPPRPHLELGQKYVLPDGAAVRAKINNKSKVGLGYQQKLRDGVTVTLSTLVNSGNINAGGHKVGVALEMEA